MTSSQFISSCLVCALFVNLSSCGEDERDDGDERGGSSGSPSATSGGAAEGGSSSGGAGDRGGADAGGAGSSGEGLTLEEACDKACADQSTLSCPFVECVTECMAPSVTGDARAPDKYLAMLRCQAEQLGPADYACLSMDPDPVVWPAPIAETSCEPVICAWYCAEETLLGNYAVYLRCDCG